MFDMFFTHFVNVWQDIASLFFFIPKVGMLLVIWFIMKYNIIEA